MESEVDFSKGIQVHRVFHKVRPLLAELGEDLFSLMHQYDYNSNGSDWKCTFCQERESKPGHIDHSDDCLGVKFQKFFEEHDEL